MKRQIQFVHILNSLLVLFTGLPSGLGKSSGGDPRWNRGVLSKEEVTRIMSLLKDINFLLRDRR